MNSNIQKMITKLIVIISLLLFIVSCVSVPQLHKMIEKGDIKGAKKRIESGQEINTVSERGYTALHMAVMRDQIEIVQDLISAGANLDIRTSNGESPLILASRLDKSDIGKLLVNSGAKIDPPYRGVNALSEAIGYGHFDLATLYVNKGADVNIQNHIGETPLFYAVQFGNEAIIRFLIKNGGNVNAKANDGRTPLHVAVMKSDSKIIDLLLQSGAEISPSDLSEVALYSSALLYEYVGTTNLNQNNMQEKIPYLEIAVRFYSSAAKKFKEEASNHKKMLLHTQVLNILSVVMAGIAAQSQAYMNAKQSPTGTGVGVVAYSMKSTEKLGSLVTQYQLLAEQCDTANQRLTSQISCLKTHVERVEVCLLKEK